MHFDICLCLPSDFFYRIICHRSSISLTALREDCLINIFLACYGGLSTFCVTPQLCVDKWHVVGLTEPGFIYIYIYIYIYIHTHTYIYIVSLISSYNNNVIRVLLSLVGFKGLRIGTFMITVPREAS